MKIKTRYLVIAAAAILVLSAAATAWTLFRGAQGATAKIFVDGEVVRTVDLTRDDEFVIETGYGFNRVRVEDGGIRVADADCPDKLCVGMGRRTDGAIPIACLPHRLVIRIEGADEPTVDAVAGVAP